jgi:hypothetical protein
VRSDEPGPTGNQHSGVSQVHRGHWRHRFTAP